jgi:hypothetical protein
LVLGALPHGQSAELTLAIQALGCAIMIAAILMNPSI